MNRRGFLMAGGALGASPLIAALKREKLDEASALVARTVEDGTLSSATLHVRQRSFTYRRAFGAAGSPDAIFLIASITKPMTATALMVLSERGELSLDDPVHRFIPEFTEGDRKLITIRHLLTHTSGLPDQLPENIELRQRHAPLEDFVAGAIRTPLLFPPGTEVRYQSMGLLLAAETAQRITQEPFPEFLSKVVLEPLGMTRSALGLGQFRIKDTQRCQVDEAPGLYGGGSGDTKSWDWNSPYWRNLAAPWGGAHSTGPDIAKFLGYFLRPRGGVVSGETALSMVVNQTEGLNQPRGIGFVVKPGSFGSSCSERAFGHGGSTGTIAWADPVSELSCVVLTTLPARVSNDLLLNPVSDLVSVSQIAA